MSCKQWISCKYFLLSNYIMSKRNGLYVSNITSAFIVLTIENPLSQVFTLTSFEFYMSSAINEDLLGLAWL